MPQSKNPAQRDPLDHFAKHCAAVKLLALLIVRPGVLIAAGVAVGTVLYGPAVLRALPFLH